MDKKFLDSLNEAGVETSEAIRRFSGKEDLYEKFLLKFLQDSNYEKIEPAVLSGDFEAALIAAHTLKGVAGNLGFVRLFEASSDLVTVIRSGETSDAPEICRQIKESYEKVCGVIKDYQGGTI